MADTKPMVINKPEPGLYKRRLPSRWSGNKVVRGKWVPVKIFYDGGTFCPQCHALIEDQILVAMESAKYVDPWKIWNYIHPVNEDEYQWLMSTYN